MNHVAVFLLCFFFLRGKLRKMLVPTNMVIIRIQWNEMHELLSLNPCPIIISYYYCNIITARWLSFIWSIYSGQISSCVFLRKSCKKRYKCALVSLKLNMGMPLGHTLILRFSPTTNIKQHFIQTTHFSKCFTNLIQSPNTMRKGRLTHSRSFL